MVSKQIKFSDNDKELIEKINIYKEEHNIKSFIEAIRVLCSAGLSKSVNVKINME